MGFRSTMRALAPARALVDLPDGGGLDLTTSAFALAALRNDPAIVAVYSIGGGNLAIVDAFDQLCRRCDVFIAHDHDQDNARLLRAGRLSAVLHHDLHADLRQACQMLMQAHGALGPMGPGVTSTIQILTPYNAPNVVA